MVKAKDIIHFWFDELTPKHWFQTNKKLDEEIKVRFHSIHKRASKGKLKNWRSEAYGRLAEIIVLDQFSRNLYRDNPKAFSQDPLALELAREAVKIGIDKALPLNKRSFLYMPFMHSESVLAHDEAVKLFDFPGMEDTLKYELKHKEIIDRFKRYPHRNKILGRESTEEEIQFLKGPGSSF